MQSQLAKLREKRENGEGGFTLIELLVVVVIIGILVAIAIPVYLNFRKGAENRSAQSDVRNAVTTIEQCFNDGGQLYPTTAISASTATSNPITCGTTGSGSISISTGNTLTYSLDTGGKTYQVAVRNTDSGSTFTYKSSDGSTTKS